MGGRMSREKGARGEREIIGMLQPMVDEVCEECGVVRFELRRNPSQRFAPKQYDVIGLPWIALEVKRVENLGGLGSWWKQTLNATGPGQVPVLVYRPNNRPWKARLNVPVSVVKGEFVNGTGFTPAVNVRMTIDINWHSFTVWFKVKLRTELS